MKTATWQQLVEYFKGYTVGGEAIVRIDRKHISLGKMRNGVFAWTPAGLELANTVVLPRPTATSSPSRPTTSAPRRRALPTPPEVPNAGSED